MNQALQAEQAERTVAYLGPAASFTHAAAADRFGREWVYAPQPTIGGVFAALARGEAARGVVPIENSTAGYVLETLDGLVDAEFAVLEELVAPISLCLLALGDRAAISTVYSKDNALGQSRDYLNRELPGRTQVAIESTSRAAELAAADPSVAAIGTALAADLYGLRVLDRDIQDLADNWTRFAVIGARPFLPPSGRDRTMLALSIVDRVGVLRDILGAFSDRAVNIISIQSRPSRRKAWDYIFFLELNGHADEAPIREALAAVRQDVVLEKVLGTWPRP